MPFRARRYIGSSVTSCPFNSTRPESGAVRPTVMWNVVVLPAPFGPSKPTTSPDETSRLTPRTTVRPPYYLVSWCVRSVAIRRDAHSLALPALGLRSDLIAAVDDDGIGGPGQGQRLPRRLAAALIDDRD